MLTLTTRLPADGPADAELALTQEQREKTRLRARLACGEEVAVLLERGPALLGGERLRGDDGRVVRVVAAPEAVLRVECHDADEYARCAYHLGNRHTPVQLLGRLQDGHFALAIRPDHVLADMLAGLGAHSHEALAPFEPEGGAYGGHAHGGGDHSHGHGHHDQDHGHDHAHVPHPGNRMPAHEPKIHRPDLSVWKGTQDK